MMLLRAEWFDPDIYRSKKLGKKKKEGRKSKRENKAAV